MGSGLHDHHNARMAWIKAHKKKYVVTPPPDDYLKRAQSGATFAAPKYGSGTSPDPSYGHSMISTSYRDSTTINHRVLYQTRTMSDFYNSESNSSLNTYQNP